MAVRLPQNQNLSETVIARGIVRDVPRHQIQPGGVYDATDFLFDRPGSVYKRGGSAFQSSELSDETIVVAVAAPEFPGDPRVIAIGSDGANRTLYDVTASSAATGIDVNGAQPTENPPLYVDKMILCDGLGDGMGVYADVQKVYLSTGTVAVGDLGGSPPNARYSCVHLSYLVLANTVANPNRLFFSPIPDIEAAWDTTNAYIDVPTAITGLASIQGVLVVFTRGNTWRVLYDIPPGTTGENMELQPLGAVGCIDARSIVKMNGLVYFADESGLYWTNGAGYESATLKADDSGISSIWADAIAGYTPSLGSVVCAGVWLNQHLFVTIRHADTDPQSGARYQFLYHEPSRTWTRLSDGVTATMYATRFAPDGEIYAGCGDINDPVQVLRLSGLFVPDGDNASDANGDAVEPQITYRPFAAGMGLKAFGDGHLTYDMRVGTTETWTADHDYTSGDLIFENGQVFSASTGTSDDTTEPDWVSVADVGDTIADGTVTWTLLGPQLAVSTAPDLEAPMFTERTRFYATSESMRRRFGGSKDSEALSVKVVQSGPSDSTELFAVEMEARPYDIASEVP